MWCLMLQQFLYNKFHTVNSYSWRTNIRRKCQFGCYRNTKHQSVKEAVGRSCSVCLWHVMCYGDCGMAREWRGCSKGGANHVHCTSSSFKTTQMKPFQQLNKLKELKLDSLIPKLYIAFRIFCIIPVTVVEADVAKNISN